jgi:hypothetical protein
MPSARYVTDTLNRAIYYPVVVQNRANYLTLDRSGMVSAAAAI